MRARAHISTHRPLYAHTGPFIQGALCGNREKSCVFGITTSFLIFRHIFSRIFMLVAERALKYGHKTRRRREQHEQCVCNVRRTQTHTETHTHCSCKAVRACLCLSETQPGDAFFSHTFPFSMYFHARLTRTYICMCVMYVRLTQFCSARGDRCALSAP